MHAGDVNEQTLRAARANRAVCTDEKHIRADNTVMYESKDGLGPLFPNRSRV